MNLLYNTIYNWAHFILVMLSVYVVGQLYPWFKFYLPFFQTHYNTYKGTYNKSALNTALN